MELWLKSYEEVVVFVVTVLGVEVNSESLWGIFDDLCEYPVILWCELGFYCLEVSEDTEK